MANHISPTQHIFIEDIRAGLIPHRRSAIPNLSFGFEGPQTEVEKASVLCGSLAQHESSRPDENVLGAVDGVALHLSYYGKAFFEIIRDPTDLTIVLSSFNPDYAWHIPGFYFQLAPRKTWSYLDGKKYALLHASDVWHIEMPKELGGARAYRRALHLLSSWSDLGPRFFQKDLENQNFPKEYAPAEYRKRSRSFQYKVTNRWGWNMRDWTLDNVTEYYQFRRFITYKHAQAIMRQHIISDLNKLLARVGISARMFVNGLPSPADIFAIEEKMNAGLIDFGQVATTLV